MTDVVHDYELFLAKNLVDDPVISFPKLGEACEIAFQRLRCDPVKVLSEPTKSIYDALSDGGIDPLQFATGGFEDAGANIITPASGGAPLSPQALLPPPRSRFVQDPPSDVPARADPAPQGSFPMLPPMPMAPLPPPGSGPHPSPLPSFSLA